ncbi:MAG: hypothetical protein HY673_19120 [Chloroflexi bacterium]|nr:hypothetical protein [Chloroflexota bacterium]
MRKPTVWLCTLLLAGFAFAGHAHATIFGVKSCIGGPTCGVAGPFTPAHLFSFLENGSGFTDIGTVALGGTAIDTDGLAMSPSHGLLGFHVAATGSTLISLNPITAVATAIGPVLPGRHIRGAVFDLADILRVLDTANNELLQINPNNGSIVGAPVALTLGGNPFTLPVSTDIAVRANGIFYVVSITLAPSPQTDFYTLDVGTGALTLVFSDSALQDGLVPSFPGITFSRVPSSPSHLFGYDANGFDDIFRYDVAVGAGSRTLVYGNIIPSFNAGLGDLAALVSGPVCHFEMTQPTFPPGSSIMIQSLHVYNPEVTNLFIEYKLWIDLPGGGTYSFGRGGDDGPTGFTHLGGPCCDIAAVIPGDSFHLNPYTLVQLVTPGSPPPGDYSINCRLEDPVTGQDLVVDKTPFMVVP